MIRSLTLAVFATLQSASSRRTPKLFRVGDREISFFATHEQARQAARRMHRHFDLVPLTVAGEVRRLVPNRILMAKFQRDLFEDVVHLSAAARIESFTARHTGELIENALAFHSQRAARVAAAENTGRVEDEVRFFNKSAQLGEGVTQVIFLVGADLK